LHLQIATALASGNRALVDVGALPADIDRAFLAKPPAGLAGWLAAVEDRAKVDIDAVLFEGDAEALRALNQELASRPGRIVAAHRATNGHGDPANATYAPEWLMNERSISTNTAAAGGNASLMAIE
jgi:RHH-type proline utilization regulon transcriptional repressor/proline dehydrogenase/delta 1-pyrroline-5-carboxylate dehydrogenase